MKHDLSVTALLLGLFLLTQVIGLGLLAAEADIQVTTVHYDDTALGERPSFSVSYGALLYLLIGVAVGTLLLFGIMRFSKAKVIWKVWYFLAIVLTSTVALGVLMDGTLALLISAILGYLKITRYNPWLHNGMEILTYSGLGLLFAPIFDVFWAAALLLIISVYDMIAVWKTKHMVKLATFTQETVFAGFLINYTPKKSAPSRGKRQVRSALLGGGDVLFTLLFSGTVFTWALQLFSSKLVAFFAAMTVASGAAIGLYLLFSYARKERFYPAMPFITLGCFAGYLLVRLVLLL